MDLKFLLFCALCLLRCSFSLRSFCQKRIQIFPEYQLKSVDSEIILEIIKRSERFGTLPKDDKIIIENWINSKSLLGNGSAVINDPIFPGNYEVSYVGVSNSREGNPAGGLFGKSVGKFAYRITGLFQNILKFDSEENLVAINIVAAKLLLILPIAVILKGQR